MPACLHDTAEASEGGAAIRRNIDNVLKYRVIEQEAVDGTVVSAGEILAKPIAVQSPNAGLAFEDATHEAHFAAVAEQIDDLVIETFVEVIPVSMLQPANGMHIPQRAYFVR